MPRRPAAGIPALSLRGAAGAEAISIRGALDGPRLLRFARNDSLYRRYRVEMVPLFTDLRRVVFIVECDGPFDLAALGVVDRDRLAGDDRHLAIEPQNVPGRDPRLDVLSHRLAGEAFADFDP